MTVASPFLQGIIVETNEKEPETIRLSIPIERSVNEQFSNIMPHGLKAQVMRCLVHLVIDTQRDLGKEKYLIHHLINGECKIVIDD